MSLERFHEIDRQADLLRDYKFLGYLHALIDFKDLLIRSNVYVDTRNIDSLFKQFEQRERRP